MDRVAPPASSSERDEDDGVATSSREAVAKLARYPAERFHAPVRAR